MRRLKRLREDRAATIVIIALVMMVLMGLVGLAIDVGAIFAERRELSRGADAAVLAVAEDCGRGIGECTTAAAMVTGEAFADANAEDGAAAIQSLTLDLEAQTVYVTTKTIDPADGTGEDDQFKLFFMRLFGFESMTVTADAAAQWGHPTGGVALTLIISQCEYDRYGPDEEWTTIYFHEGADADDCAAQAGSDFNDDTRLPGGFGWLDTDGDCVADVFSTDWVFESPGAAPSSGCRELFYEMLIGKTVLVPIFDDVKGLGANGEYHIAGFGALRVDGYWFSGQLREPTPTTGFPPCTGETRCISGHFTTKVEFDGEFGGQDFGVVLVKLIA